MRLVGALRYQTPLYSRRVLASSPFHSFQRICNTFASCLLAQQSPCKMWQSYIPSYRIIGNVYFGVCCCCCCCFLSHVNDTAITSNGFLLTNRRRLSIFGSNLLTFKFTLFILFYKLCHNVAILHNLNNMMIIILFEHHRLNDTDYN